MLLIVSKWTNYFTLISSPSFPLLPFLSFPCCYILSFSSLSFSRLLEEATSSSPSFPFLFFFFPFLSFSYLLLSCQIFQSKLPHFLFLCLDSNNSVYFWSYPIILPQASFFSRTWTNSASKLTSTSHTNTSQIILAKVTFLHKGLSKSINGSKSFRSSKWTLHILSILVWFWTL